MIKKIRILPFLLIIFSAMNFAYSSDDSVLSVLKDKSVDEAIETLESEISVAKEIPEKLVLTEKLALCQEFSTLYSEASETYVKCSKLTSDEEKKEDYVLKAVKSALAAGDYEKADKLLASIASTARNGKNGSVLKLYATWSWLSKCTTYEETFEPVTILKSYLELPSMKGVRKEILFTLWYITGDEEYSLSLKKEYPESIEYSVVLGETQLMPLPFWYFVTRNPDIINRKANVEVEDILDTHLLGENIPENDKNQSSAVDKSAKESKSDEKSEKIQNSKGDTLVYYQLGFFSSRENAKRLTDRAKAKNINAEIEEIKKDSGNVYYAVIVKATDSKTGEIIRNNGFECSPVFE